MQPQSEGEYQKLLSEVIKKQIVILGPSITLAKARNVKGLTISDDGTVTSISGNPQELTQELIEQFMDLSGLIVKKTMEPLLAGYPNLAAVARVQQAANPLNPFQQAFHPTFSPPLPPSAQPTQNTAPEQKPEETNVGQK